jgi:predicted aconitase
MNLSDEEHAMLNGEYGPGVQKAMEIITALGKIYGADDLVSVASVQVAGVSYKNLGDAGLDFLADWTAQGARVRVPTTLNPAGLDLESWRDIGFDAEFAEKQQRVIDAFAGMGIRTTCTCTPYLIGNTPQQGQHIAWAESSAVSFANSVLGARTNREGGPSALAAAITGRTARYGLHLAQNRRAHMTVEVRCAVESFSDFGALGTIVGKRARNRIPYFTNLPLPRGLTLPDPRAYDLLKTLGASMAASGAVALYHIEGVTPEASPNVVMPNAEHMVVEDLSEGYQMLNSDDGRTIDLVWMGCPHASREELAHIVELLRGRRIQVPLWVTMARSVRDEAKQAGLVDQLEAAGGKIIADTCLVVAPVNTLGFHRIATPSGKGAYYVPTHSGISVRYGSVEACVEAAITGEWEA